VGWINVLGPLQGQLPPITFAAVGAFLATRQPGNRIAWLMIAVGLCFGIPSLASDYPGYNPQTHQPTRPLGVYVAWIGNWDWPLYLLALLLLLLLFPTGTLPSRRWKPVLWIGVSAWIAISILSAVEKGQIGTPPIENPFGLIQLPVALAVAIAACGLLAMAAAVLSLVFRYRSAAGDVREQIKWFTFGAALAIVCVIAAFATLWSVGILALMAIWSLAAVPIFMGVAITRYHLYDIDLLINRALVYGSLTLSLAAVYAVGVVALSGSFRALAGQGSDLSIAASTLAVAALFQPLRRRLQTFIDRRFYRRKYNASLALTAFSSRLRNDVDLRQVTDDIASAVQETVQPAHVSIWLR
jgi:hypothetical protein